MIRENCTRGDSMPAKTNSTHDESLNEFSKSEESGEDDEQYIYYACDCEEGRHPMGVDCPNDGGEE